MSLSAFTRLFGGACDVLPWLLRLVCTLASHPSLSPAPSPSAPTPNAGDDVPQGSGEEQLWALRAPRFWPSVALLFAITAALTLQRVALGSSGQGSVLAGRTGTCTSPGPWRAPGQVPHNHTSCGDSTLTFKLSLMGFCWGFGFDLFLAAATTKNSNDIFSFGHPRSLKKSKSIPEKQDSGGLLFP